MVYGVLRKKLKPPYFQYKGESGNIAGNVIDSFISQESGSNLVSSKHGQLQQNKNMEYVSAGSKVFLRTKRGSTLVKDINKRSYGAKIYTYNLTDDYFVWADYDGNLKYCTVAGGTISDLVTGLSNGREHSFLMYGLQTISALYGVNYTDGMYKVSGSPPTYSAIANSPKMIDFCFSTESKRIFGLLNHTLYWSEAHTSITTLDNLEDFGWNVSVWDNSQIVSPGRGYGFTACIESNQVTCLFKDIGIWGLINANEDVANWSFSQLSSDTGTKSKKTVKHIRYGSSAEGICFLGSDKTLRFFDVQIERNSGYVPSITRKNSHVISVPFQDILDKIPSGYLSICTAEFYDGSYYLNIVSEFSTRIDMTLVIDMRKLLPATDESPFPQPYWYKSENMDYTDFAIRAYDNSLYGFNFYGFISKLLVSGKKYEEFPTRVFPAQDYEDVSSVRHVAIEFDAYTGWRLYSDSLLLLKSISINWFVDGDYTLTLSTSAFAKGEVLPDYTDGLTLTLKPITGSRSYFDYALFDIARFSETDGNQASQPNISLRGNYFCFGIKSTTLNSFISLYSIQPFFKVIRAGYTGKRI